MGNITSLSAFTTKLKSLMKTTFLHKRASSPDFASAKVPVTYEDNGNKTYYDSTVTGADLQKLYGASSDLPANQTITGAISTLNEKILSKKSHLFPFSVTYSATSAWGSFYQNSSPISIDISSLGLTSAPTVFITIFNSDASVWNTSLTVTKNSVNMNLVRPTSVPNITTHGVLLILEN